MKKFTITTYVTLGAAILFSLLSIHFKLDVSFWAFPVSAVFTGFIIWAFFWMLLKKNNIKFVAASIKLLQYLPYVLLLSFVIRRAGKVNTQYWYDVVTVLLWVTALVGRWILLYKLNPKRIQNLNPQWKKTEEKKSGGIIAIKKPTLKNILFEIVDWIDAIVQAVFTVLLVQIFIFQLYVIPSESMVPSFLVKDRVVVFKTSSGPKFPLSKVGLPCVKNYKRGDVVVFRNPQYGTDRQNEIRFVASQLIYMLSFTTININVDSNGNPKADPLVKRICGVPGEQLVMQDGSLYARTKDSDEWIPVQSDNKFAAWNLNKYASKFSHGSIKEYPISQEEYDVMLAVEEERRNLDMALVARECSSLYKQIGSYVKNSSDSVQLPLYANEIFGKFTGVTRQVISGREGYAWLKTYLTDWINNYDSVKASLMQDAYTEANYKLNAMFKLYSGRLFLRTAQLLSQGKDQSSFAEDSKFMECYDDLRNVTFYINILDQRNMPVFPKNDENGNPVYIPDGSYFMMGDNRFNSLDMRHKSSFSEEPLTEFDNYSIRYSSCLEQKYVSKDRILGTASYRFWPLNRVGTIKTK